MRPPARAIVGHVVWSHDGSAWAVWSVKPFPHAHTSAADKLSVHSRLRSLLVNLPGESMLLSISERLDPLDVVERMAEGVDLNRSPAWAAVCDSSAGWLGQVPLRRRLFYLAAELPRARRPLLDALRGAAAEVGASFGVGPAAVPAAEVQQRLRQARELEVRLAQHTSARPLTAGEICWLYARSLRRGVDEPPFDERWEPPVPPGSVDDRGDVAAVEAVRSRGVLAHLTDAVVTEGGTAEDEDRPRHRRYVRIDGDAGTTYQTVVAMADMPHHFRFPGGGGEWLYHADNAGFPVDWCVRTRSVANADAQTKVRRKHRDLIGQIEEYDGELTGAPPQLAEAIRAIDDERGELGANPGEPELQATVLMSIAATSLPELEDRAGALAAMFEPHEYGLARPTGGQTALLRSMLPGTPAAPVCRDYTQFMLARDLAAGSPFCGSDVGDPRGLLLGLSLDGGAGTPVLFDPAYGPQRQRQPVVGGRRPARARASRSSSSGCAGTRLPGAGRWSRSTARRAASTSASPPPPPDARRSCASRPGPTSASTRCAASRATSASRSRWGSSRCWPAARRTARRGRHSPTPSTRWPPGRTRGWATSSTS